MAWGRKCGPTPSPHQSPVSLPAQVALPIVSHDYDHHIHQIHLLRGVMIAIASTLGVILLLLAVLKIVGYYCFRRHYDRRRNSPILFDIHGDTLFSDDEETTITHPIWLINTVGLQQSVIDSITVCKYKKDEGLVEGTECSVCLGEFQEDESLRLLPKCSHAFHVPCIDTWLRSRKNCPLCRAPIVRETSGREASVVTVSDSIVSSEIHVGNLDDEVGNSDVGEGESSQLRLGDDDSGIMPTEDREDGEVSDISLATSAKTNCRSSRVSRSASVHSSTSAYEARTQNLTHSF